jgi:hypothetical protein
MATTKFADQVTQLTNLLSSYSQMASEVTPKTMHATVLNSDTIQIDGSESSSPLVTGESPGTKIQVQIRNHQIVRVDSTPTVIENSYDDTDLVTKIAAVDSALEDLVSDVTESNDNTADLFNRLTEYLNTLVDEITSNEEVDDEASELLDDLVEDLGDNLEVVQTAVETVKSETEAANALAKEAYDGVYPITSEMRDLLGDLADLADFETAETEERSATYEREGEYSQAKAEYHYNQSKSASRWSQTLIAELDAWAKNDSATQQKIANAKTALATANMHLTTAQDAEITAEETHKKMVSKYNIGYQIYLKAQSDGNEEKVAAAKNLVDEASNDIYGAGCTKDSFSTIESALTTLEEKLKSEDATTETCESELSAVEAALKVYSGNTGSLYALLESRYNVAKAEAEVGTAVYGIHQLQSTSITQTANQISLKASTTYVNNQVDGATDYTDKQIAQAETTIKAEAVDTAIKTLKSDGSLAKGTLIHDYNGGSLVCKINESMGCLANANGSFDIVNVTWTTSTNDDGETEYTPHVASTAAARFDKSSVTFSNGVSFSSTNTTGLFYVGTGVKKSGTIAAGANGLKIEFSYAELGGGKSSTEYTSYIKPYGLRPVAPVRINTNHQYALKIAGWNYNPSAYNDPTDTSLSEDDIALVVRVNRSGASTKNKMSVTVYVQTLWVRASIAAVDSSDADLDGDDDSGSGDTGDGSGYLKGSLDGTTLTITIE